MLSFAEIQALNPAYPDLNKRIHAYWDRFFSGDYKGCLDYIYPPLLEAIPRKRMLEGLKKAFTRKSQTITIDLTTIDEISKVVEADEGDYCRIDYTMLMAIQFKTDQQVNLPKTEAKKKKKREFILAAYKAQYGDENAWFDEITKSYCIYVKNKLLAIRDKHSQDWSFMMLTDHPLTKQLIPKSVLIILND